MSDIVQIFDKGRANACVWDWMNPNSPVFAIIFPKTAAQAAKEKWPPNITIQKAVNELRQEVRNIVFPSLRKDDIVDEIVSEVLVRVGEERPFGSIDATLGDGRGLFRVFLNRRVTKEVNRLFPKRRGITLDGVEHMIQPREWEGNTEESREVLACVAQWIPSLPPMQGKAFGRWMELLTYVSDMPDETDAPIPLSNNERTNLCRAFEALRRKARAEGMLN